MKKIIFNLSILLICMSINSSAMTKGGKSIEDLKYIILSDLIILNQLNDSLIIDTKTIFNLISPAEGDKQYFYADLDKYINSSVKIVKIDSFDRFFNVHVLFNVSFKEPFMNDDTFLYTVYNSASDFYKINGFVVSDILQLDDFQINRMHKNVLKIKDWKAFRRSFKKRSANIASYLKIETLYKLNHKYRISTFYNPLLRTENLNLIGYRW